MPRMGSAASQVPESLQLLKGNADETGAVCSKNDTKTVRKYREHSAVLLQDKLPRVHPSRNPLCSYCTNLCFSSRLPSPASTYRAGG